MPLFSSKILKKWTSMHFLVFFIKIIKNETYPKQTSLNIIKDIGSGINMERKWLKKIIKMAIDGVIWEIVVTSKDRLVRFGYELIEWLIKTYSKGEIKIIHKKWERKMAN